MLPTTFLSIWPSCFRIEDFQKSTNQKQEFPVAAMFFNGSKRNHQSLEDLPQMLPTKCRFIWPSGFRGEDLKKLVNQKQELPVVAMFVNELGLNDQSSQRIFQGSFLPNFGSFGKTGSEEKIIQKSTNQKQELPVSALGVNKSGRNEQSLQRTFHRCFLPSFGSFGQVVSEEKIFQKTANQK